MATESTEKIPVEGTKKVLNDIGNLFEALSKSNTETQSRYQETHKLHVKNNQKLNEQADFLNKLNASLIASQAKQEVDNKSVISQIAQTSTNTEARFQKHDDALQTISEQLKNVLQILNDMSKITQESFNAVLSHFEKYEKIALDPDYVKSKKLLQSKNDEISHLRETMDKLISLAGKSKKE